MAVEGIVRSWDDDEGWGVVDSPETPGGCWAHYSHLAMPGFRTLSVGQPVQIEWEAPGFLQDGFRFRAVRVWTSGQQPPTGEPQSGVGRIVSRRTLLFDPPDQDAGPGSAAGDGELLPGWPAAQQMWQAAAELVRADIQATLAIATAVEVSDWASSAPARRLDRILARSPDAGNWPPRPPQVLARLVPICSVVGDFDAHPHDAAAQIADQAQSDIIEHEQVTWPGCPAHEHPLDPVASADGADWVCSRDPLITIPIGRLTG